MCSIASITDDQKQKAFERARDEAKLKDGKLMRLSEEHHRIALDFARDHFVPDEPVTANSGYIWGPDVEEEWLDVFRQGFSLILLTEDEKEIVAFRVTRAHKLEKDPYKLDHISDPGTRRVWALLDYCDQRAKVLEHFKVEESLHLVGLCVNKKYRRKGLAVDIMRAALTMYQYLGVDPICVKGEASSNYSKKVYAKTGFKQFFDQPYVDYVIDGEQVFKNTGEHKSIAALGQLLKGKIVEDGQTKCTKS